MQELKFRAWGNQQNKYLNPDDVSISADGFITVFNADGKHSRAVQPPRVSSPWFVIEQYTGLKDKNGTEIYEGDVVLYNDEMPFKVYWGDVVAQFLAGKKGVVGQSFDMFTYDCDTQRITELEVVGNIHENPELLEKK